MTFLVALPAFGDTPSSNDAETEAKIRRMDALWSQRANPGPMEEIVSVGEEILRDEPGSYDAMWRVARSWWWIGHSTDDLKKRREVCDRARGIAAEARRLRPGAVEAEHAYAYAVGDYATSLGVVAAVVEGVGGEFERAMKRVYEIDRDYDDGAAIVSLGRFYWMLPWPLRDLKESRRYLEEARERHPRNLTGRLFLAETYRALSIDGAAREELEHVSGTEPAAHRRPEDGSMPEEARRRLSEWFGVSS